MISANPIHFQPYDLPFKGHGRKILPKGATPSITATSTDRKVDPVVSSVKAELRVQTYYINALLEIMHNIALNRGKTNKQGSSAPKGWQAGHASLTPETFDTHTTQTIQRVVKNGLTPTKSRPFLEHRIGLTPIDAQILNDHQGDEDFVSQFIIERLPDDGIHSALSDTRYNWNCNATFENPDESNEFDSRLEKAILKFQDKWQVLRLNGTDTAEKSTEKLVIWLTDYYQKSIANLKQKEADLTETASCFDRMRKFELRTLNTKNIPHDEFSDYLGDLQAFLKSYDALIEKKIGCPTIKEIQSIRNDFKFLRKIAALLQKNTPLENILSIYQGSRHLGKEMPFNRDKLFEKYKFYQEEAAAQMAAIEVFNEPCTIPHMKAALFGKKDAGGARCAPSEQELKQQIFALSSPASPVKAKIAARKLTPVPFAGYKRKADDHPEAPASKKVK